MIKRRFSIKAFFPDILAILVCAGFITAVMAENGTTDVNVGIEPGDGCEQIKPGFECFAPFGAPLGGEVTLSWFEFETGGVALLSGRVDQFGPGNCAVHTERELLPGVIPNGKAFRKLRARKLRGFCLDNVQPFSALTIEEAFGIQFPPQGPGQCLFPFDTAEVLDAKITMRSRDVLKLDVIVTPIICNFVPPPPP